MKIINERYSSCVTSLFLSCIIQYNDRLFKIDGGPTKLYVWSGLNGWLYIDSGDRKETTQEHIDQFMPIMKAFTFTNDEKTI